MLRVKHLFADGAFIKLLYCLIDFFLNIRRRLLHPLPRTWVWSLEPLKPERLSESFRERLPRLVIHYNRYVCLFWGSWTSRHATSDGFCLSAVQRYMIPVLSIKDHPCNGGSARFDRMGITENTVDSERRISSVVDAERGSKWLSWI
jgi:hypothetical protein